MIILDTNVVSETIRRQPDTRVMNWLGVQLREHLFLTATVMAEILLGIERMPVGKRRRDFERWAEQLWRNDFVGRVLAFDEKAAERFARLVANAQTEGFSPAFPDAQIAAVASAHGFAIATRNVAHFTPLGVPVIDPWTAL